MVQGMFKEIAQTITFAMQLDVPKNVPNSQLVVYLEMGMAQKEIAMVIHSVTQMDSAHLYVQKMGLLLVMAMEPRVTAQ